MKERLLNPLRSRRALTEAKRDERAGSIPIVAFYLPQFHQVVENDEFWGEGFTDWRNVEHAKPQFTRHHQPHRPGELGVYDLTDAEARARQAELASAFGITGFCYYYYWFDGRRILERPLDGVLASGAPNFPFCIAWANEAWSRRWDGSSHELLVPQEYRPGFATDFAEDVAPILADPRYIHVDGRPLLLVYRADQLPEPRAVTDTWRRVLRAHGLGDVLLAAVEWDGRDVRRLGFDVGVEFPPHNPSRLEHQDRHAPRLAPGLVPEFEGELRRYELCARLRIGATPPSHPRFRGVMPGWDNTPRARRRAMIYLGASPERYRDWLAAALLSARAQATPLSPVVFVNAWNEWAEGAYLEPDERLGRARLIATAEARALARRGEAINL